MTDSDLRKKLKDNVGLAYYWPKSFKTAKGYWLESIEGEKMLDFTSGWGVANIGWGNEEVIALQKQQIEKSSYAPPWFPTEESLELSKRLLSLFPDTKYKCVRSTGGANGNEIALSIFANMACSCKQNTPFCGLQTCDIGTFKRSYHGWSQATLGMSEHVTFNLPKVRSFYRSVAVDFPKETEDSLAFSNRIFDTNPNIKVFVAEPILGSGGAFVPPKDFWKVFSRVCKERGVYLVLDESITAFGRIGHLTACHYFDVRPDALVLAKGLTSGYAILGATLVKEEFLKDNRTSDVTATFAWTPYACAVTCKVMDILERDNLCQNALDVGEYFKSNLYRVMSERLNKKFEVRGVGLLLGLSIYRDNGEPDVFTLGKLGFYCAKQGLVVTTSGDNQTIIFLPPLVLDKAGADKALEIIDGYFTRK